MRFDKLINISKNKFIFHTGTIAEPGKFDLHLAMPLSHKICSKMRLNKWCRKQESNLRPTDYETVTLPTELFRQ